MLNVTRQQAVAIMFLLIFFVLAVLVGFGLIVAAM